MSNANAIPEPMLVRKLARKNHWGPVEDNTVERVQAILQQLFDPRDRPFSLYQVATAEDLDRVALALNGGRSSLTEDVAFAAFPKREVEQAEIALVMTPGETLCHYANSLHCDADVEPSVLERIVALAVQNNREVIHYTKGQMKRVVEQGRHERCDVITEREQAIPPGCLVAMCAARPSVRDSATIDT